MPVKKTQKFYCSLYFKNTSSFKNIHIFYNIEISSYNFIRLTESDVVRIRKTYLTNFYTVTDVYVLYVGEQGMQSKTKRSPTQQDVRTRGNERQCVTCAHTPPNYAEKKKSVGLSLTLKCHRPRCCIHKRAYVKPPFADQTRQGFSNSTIRYWLSIDFLSSLCFLRLNERTKERRHARFTIFQIAIHENENYKAFRKSNYPALS